MADREPPPSDPGCCAICRQIIPVDARTGLCPTCLVAKSFHLPRTTHGGLMRTAPHSSSEEIDETISGYEVLELIGSGGMGAVYKARQRNLDRIVALKVLAKGLQEKNPQFSARFRREAQAMAKLIHPNIVAVYDFGETPNGRYYFVMEFVEGPDLQFLLRKDGLAPDQVVEVMLQVCEGIQCAHRNGIVHRDIKPSNILMDQEGKAKVADFGIVKLIGQGQETGSLTRTDAVLGTPFFMGPEQADPLSEVDQRTDVYSLGVLLYTLLTGHVPGRNDLPPSAFPGIDPRFDAITSKAMAEDPEMRFQSVAGLGNAISRIANTPRLRSRILVSVAVALMTLPLVIFFSNTGISTRIDRMVQDWWHTRRAPIPISDDLVIVGITDECVERFGEWPWDRARHAELIRRVKAAGASEIVFDTLFDQPAPSDRDLVDATFAAGNVFHAVSPNATPDARGGWSAKQALLPQPGLIDVAAGLGHTVAKLDSDGSLRRVPLFVRYQEQDLPALGLALAMHHLGADYDDLRGAGRQVIMNLPKGARIEVPIDEFGQAIINYPSPFESLHTVRFSDVLEGDTAPGFFKGRSVLVGGWATATGDRRVTPLSANTPGVFVHAALANSILTAHFLRNLDAKGQFVALILVLSILAAAFSSSHRGLEIAIAIALLVAVPAVGSGAFNSSGVVSRVSPLLAGIVIFCVLSMMVRIVGNLGRPSHRTHPAVKSGLKNNADHSPTELASLPAGNEFPTPNEKI